MIELLICATLSMSDGDSGRCDGQRVRIHGIDAPELQATRCRTQPTIWACLPANRVHAVQSRDRARQLVRNGASCQAIDTDRYQRSVVRCRVNGRDLGETLVREGMAIADPTYGREYRTAEARARREGRGVWG